MENSIRMEDSERDRDGGSPNENFNYMPRLREICGMADTNWCTLIISFSVPWQCKVSKFGHGSMFSLFSVALMLVLVFLKSGRVVLAPDIKN